MAGIDSKSNPAIGLEVGRSFGAARIETRPLEFRNQSGEIVGGHYRTVLVTGLITVLNAGDAVLSARWTDKALLMALLRARVFGIITTAFTTAQEVSFDLVRVNSFRASDTGGTDATPGMAAGAGKKRSDMPHSLIGDLRVATTVALGAGAGSVNDGAAFGFAGLAIGNAVGSSAAEELFNAKQADGEHPAFFARNEGVRARVGFTQGAAGVLRATFVLDWAEVPAF